MKFPSRDSKFMIFGAVLGAIVTNLAWLNKSEDESLRPSTSMIEPKTQNEWNAYENAYCIKAGMKGVLEQGKIVCHPNNAARSVQEFWETSLGEEVIREKLREEGYAPHGQVNWPDNPSEPIATYRKAEFKPTNPESFETKSKVTE